MNLKNIAVIGLGTLGTQIAVQAAAYGCNVKGYDQDPEMFKKMLEKTKFMMAAMGKGPTVSKE
ncbi:MAG: 3-hydroxyacyl-CoA dehydrogenase NAD-binding domain-containing protein, partial [Syntrophales bacterium]|nr:3-hydroxyacyl-CoA dehydrogenase NAD-binding domain-containing protein [Syntrophales bacterium]